MDTLRLRYFVKVAELGSFSAAARRLCVAQPALSRHVKALETQLGVELLIRESSGVRMTKDGEELLLHARSALEQLDALPCLIGRRSARVSGRVVIGLPTSASAVLAKPVLQAALARFPEVRLHLIESLSGFLQEWIEGGRLDLCVLYDARPGPGIRLDPILIEDLWLVGAPAGFTPGQAEVRLQDLPRYPLIVPGASHSHRRLVEGMALSHGVRLNVLAEVDSLTALKSMTADGGVFTIVPLGAVHAEVAAGVLHGARIVDPIISRSVALVSATARSDNQACQAIARLSFEVARGLVNAQVWRGRLIAAADDQAITTRLGR